MNKRVLSVDVLRGIVITLMILVNLPTGKMFTQLAHSEWFGITLADMVFPAFLLICGISIYFSLSKYQFKLCKNAVFRIIKRFILLMLVAYIMYWICDLITAAFAGENIQNLIFDFSKLRITGVLQRIAFCSLIASFIVLFVHNKKAIIGIIVVLIIAYSCLLTIGHNALVMSEDNILTQIDIFIFGADHIYSEVSPEGIRTIFDPEGLISSIFCVSQVLVGFLVGQIITKPKMRDNNKSLNLFVFGFILIIIGYIYESFIPYCKSLWTPPYMLMTSGIITSFLALLYYVIDYKGHKKWSTFFQIFGLNAITIYVISQIMAYTLIGSEITTYGFEFFMNICNFEQLATLMFSLCFTLFMWLIAFILYKAKIVIKL